MSKTLIQSVKDGLSRGLDNADAIRHQTGMPIESVYEALVSLEGNGQARVIAPGHGNGTASWGAL